MCEKYKATQQQQEECHRKAGTHPGPQYEWVWNGKGNKDHPVDLTVESAFNEEGEKQDGFSSWKLKEK